MRTAVITIVAGRHDHLVRQRAALDPAEHHVVVAMGEGEAERCRRLVGSDVIAVEARPDGLPLARARNAGARHALAAGAELLVFLDVDCIPGREARPALPGGGRDAARPAVRSGRLPAVPRRRAAIPRQGCTALATPHPARPVPPEDEIQRGGDHALFWTLSFAVTADTWRRVGGFCEDYVGYGGEDTDFGQLAARAGVDLWWVGGAWAYHQHHATETPPVRHLADILRNATLFHRRWGWWPMSGWLAAFAERGLARHDRTGDRWVAVSEGSGG